MYLDRLEYKKDTLRIFDGRCRLLSLAVLLAAVLTSTRFFVSGGMILLCLAALARELRVTILRLVPINIMSAAIWLPLAVKLSLAGGLPPLAGLSLADGFEPAKALLYTLRINCAALVSMCLVFPMGISALAASLAGLRAPPKLISLFILSYRYIFLLHEKLSTALVSMDLRRAAGGDLYRWRSLSAVFASALGGALFRGKKVWAAMRCRGFDGAFPPTAVLKWKFRDSLLLAACTAFLVLVIIDEYGFEYGTWKNWF